LEILEFLAFRKKLFAGQRKAQIEHARVNLVFLDFRENQIFLKKGVSFLAPRPNSCKNLSALVLFLHNCTEQIRGSVYDFRVSVYDFRSIFYFLFSIFYFLFSIFNFLFDHFSIRSLSCELRVSSFEFRVSSLEFRVFSFDLLVSSFDLRVSSFDSTLDLLSSVFGFRF
jgi:hypothetical protein